MTINEYIKKYVAEDFDAASALPFPTKEIEFPKGSILTHYGGVEKHAYFLRKGVVEISIHNGEKESILEFILADSFFCSYASFLTGTPSDTRIECLTDCTVDVIYREDILCAYRHSLIANQLGRHATEWLYLRRSAREKEFLTADAEQRYRNLLSNRPNLLDIIPLYKIANYLGIHPESLSRIRKKIDS